MSLPGRHVVWDNLARLLLLGYLSMGRSFAYVGFAPVKAFVGELVLGVFLFAHAGTFVRTWAAPLVIRSRLSSVVWLGFLFVGYGIFEVLRGIGLGYPPLTALQCLAFNYYPLYLFLGLSIGQRHPQFLQRFIRPLAWAHGLYGVIYILFLNSSTVLLPHASVRLFGAPGGSTMVLLGLLTLEPNVRKVWPLLVLNGFVLLGMQIRSQWTAFAIALLFYACVMKRVRRLIAAVLVIATVLGVMYATDLTLPGPIGRGGTISVRALMGRAIAAVDPELARDYTTGVETYSDTANWRLDWWGAIWASVHQDAWRALVGHGYGFPLPSVAPSLVFPDLGKLEGAGMALRTPHSVFFYALGYGGWLGLLLFVALHLSLARLLWHSYRLTGQPFGLLAWVAAMTDGSFTSVFESPYGAIPLYILVGLSIAPLVPLRGAPPHTSRSLYARAVIVPPRSAARWRSRRAAQS